MVHKSAARAALAASAKRLLGVIREGSRGDVDVEGYYLSPSAPGVAEHLEDVVRELLATYPVDGLHLDFIRYPGPDYDYSRVALQEFARRRGGGDLLSGPTVDAAGWDAYRRDVLTELTTRLARVARLHRPDLIVSAAVVPDEASAVSQKFQAWPTWIARGLLDAVCPMIYTPDSRLFQRQVEQARVLVGTDRPLWAGVGAYRLQAAEVIDRIRTARRSGASGVLVFSHESLDADGWRRIREEAFPRAVAAGGGPAPGAR
jgi:uncharacterized lipoprotein YddW (UPF0748 family)